MISKKILMSGNEAMAEAAIRAGCEFYAGYPITPQNELIAYMARNMPKDRVFIQAESEVAAINMVFGASAAGARAMTSSSSPGISLKQEGISYLAGAQLPAVIINVMRGGPGLGNISSSQSDYFQATRGGGHGDYYTPVLAPFSVEESAVLVIDAFDLADRYRTPVFVLVDAIVGQMMEPMQFPEIKQKDVLSRDWPLTGAKNRSPRDIRSLYLGEGILEKHNQKLNQKWQKIKNNEQRFAEHETKDCDYLVVAYGGTARICQESVDGLRKAGLAVGLFRPISLWPYPATRLREISAKVKKIFVVEQSLGQMVEDVRLSLPEHPMLFLGKPGGWIPSCKEIIEFIKNNI